MTVAFEYPQRVPSMPMTPQAMTLEDRFEVIKELGDGSFGTVALARVRTAGAHIARRGTMVAIKTMKKTFDSFAPCLELREVIFLRSLPTHVHLVPALDIFLDSTTKRLHICMEYMDINLYQLMKSRERRCLDGASVKSILYQILSGLDHIHTNNFFHRDIKPENILISTSSTQDTMTAFRRYSTLMTPPGTPPVYTVKIADFGLARETYSKAPYTTYVSTRWYRAPEVLLRAGEYSAPVDIWALGAMAVEIATLKPLFPGGNEVDQVWRICEIMGSPGNWYNKSGAKVGGGDWREGVRLAQKLGFSFPKMAPHSLETVLQPPQWPAALSNFVTWCLMWDPKNRPTSLQAMNHEYFTDAVDPLTRPKSSSRLLGRKQSQPDTKAKDTTDVAPQRTSWFRKSLIGRDSAPSLPHHASNPQLMSPGPSPVQQQAPVEPLPRGQAAKRATWTNGVASSMAPMPILPSIRPISPLSNAVTAQGRNSPPNGTTRTQAAAATAPKKIGRQLSLASHGNHYGDLNAERSLHGLGSPTSAQKEGFFSHLRKRARRLSGRNQIAVTSPRMEDPLLDRSVPTSNRSSMLVDQASEAPKKNSFMDLDQALHSVRYSEPAMTSPVQQSDLQTIPPAVVKRNTSLHRSADENQATGHFQARNRRSLHRSAHPAQRYETPDEEEELLDEALNGAHCAARGLDRDRALATKDLNRSQMIHHSMSLGSMVNPYPTPSPSGKRSGVIFGNGQLEKPVPMDVAQESFLHTPTTPVALAAKGHRNDGTTMMWPTPPSQENEWAATASASIFAAGSVWR